MPRGVPHWHFAAADQPTALFSVDMNARPDLHDKGLSREKTLLPALDGRFLKRPTSCTRWLSRFAFADPLSIRSTALRDQTSICGNSAKPSTKIELK